MLGSLQEYEYKYRYKYMYLYGYIYVYFYLFLYICGNIMTHLIDNFNMSHYYCFNMRHLEKRGGIACNAPDIDNTKCKSRNNEENK